CLAMVLRKGQTLVEVLLFRVPDLRRAGLDESNGYCSRLAGERRRYGSSTTFQSRGPNPGAVLEARHLLGARDPREPTRGRTRRLYDRTDARLQARGERRSAEGQEDRKRAALRAGDRPERAPE